MKSDDGKAIEQSDTKQPPQWELEAVAIKKGYDKGCQRWKEDDVINVEPFQRIRVRYQQ